MSEFKRALVLHVAGSGEPVVFALSERGAKNLTSRLVTLMNSGGVDNVELAAGNAVAVNFAHVVSAHLDELPPLSRVYGSGTQRGHGFSS